MKILWFAPYPLQKHKDIEVLLRGKPEYKCTWLYNLAIELVKKPDIELHIVSYGAKIPLTKYIYTDNIHFHLINNGVPFTQKGYPKWMPFDRLLWYYPLVFKMKRIARLLNVDLIHAHGTETAYAFAACKAGFPYIISIQGIINEIQKVNPTFNHILQSKIEDYAIKKSKYFGCRTEWDKNYIQSLNSSAKIYYLPEAINPIYFEKKKKNPLEKHVLFVGSVSFAKGIDVLIGAARIVHKRFPEVIFDIVGPGNKMYLKEIRNKINDFGLSSVIKFHGFKKADEIKEFHNNSRVFVLPSRMENSPNAICEAMASGLPCIASRAGGIPSIIKDGYSGLLFETGNYGELAEKIIKLLSNSSFSEEIANNARQIAIERNYPTSVAKQTIKVYKEIFGSFFRQCHFSS